MFTRKRDGVFRKKVFIVEQNQVPQTRDFFGRDSDAVDERVSVIVFNDEELLDRPDFCTNRPNRIHARLMLAMLGGRVEPRLSQFLAVSSFILSLALDPRLSFFLSFVIDPPRPMVWEERS